MKQRISEATISKLVEAVVRKGRPKIGGRPTIGERTDHARDSFPHVVEAIQKVKKLLDDPYLHPHVRKRLEVFSDTGKETLKGLNRMAVGLSDTDI